MRGGRKLISFTVLACLGTCSPVVLAQSISESSPVTQVSGLRCGCGRWTCPACQQQQLCEPCLPGQVPSGVPAPICSPDMSLIPAPSVTGVPSAPPMSTVPPAENNSPPNSFSLGDNSPPAAPTPQAPSPSDSNSINFSDGGAASPAPTAAGPNAASLFAANMGAGAVGGFGSVLSGATTPEMMGDFFGPGGVPSVFSRDSNTYVTAIPNAAYGLGRMKLAENNSPIPRDRIFFNYSLFTGVPLANEPVTVNRFSPGFEKTFLGGLASFELRTPFGSTIDNDVFADGSTTNQEVQFGNLFLGLKGVLLQKDNWLLTSGASLLLPTAADTRVIDPMSDREFLRINNESTHIMPFIGGAYLPTNRLFAQWMVQCDIDANGNSVIVTDGNAAESKIGTLQDFTLLYTDMSIGYWLYKAGRGERRAITGIAPVTELHYNRALTEGDVVSDDRNIVSGVLSDFDNVNIQVGVIFDIRRNSRLGLGYATPLGNKFDRVFDNEFRVTYNRYF
jgi:hypothetical protein